MICPSCSTENEAGRKFCGECGAKLALTCPSCGTANSAGMKFCGECGAALGAQPKDDLTSPPASPSAERRLVSVLFADLVGFTTLSEARDAEEVRELLSRYFESCKRLISLYGGTVEKFIGDAVMAVWGTPVAQEDDAERAVRAALDLVAAVSALGDEVGAAELKARAGVLTGEAAVTIGAEGQGMVAGDLVNTASRIQASAEPASVLVGESTKRASEAAIAYEDAGEQELKGKAEPVPLFQALRVIAGRMGEGRAAGLEAPFVGRDAEFRLIRDLYHATASERKARLVSIIGVAGIGKSRLGWEFYKYFDGLVEQIWWHRGRCLAYGEGVAYWALAEMVRMRAGIAEDEEPDAAGARLGAALEEYVLDPEERGWIEPRLQHLLGLAERSAPDREDLFSAWRLFFERLAEQGPAVFLFEDLQWADNALLDFIEYLLEWSRAYPIYVLALARPELMERRPTWGAGTRNATSLFLEPLTDEAMDELLQGLAPGLPEGLRARIRERAEGIPLYAVETVRMLLDRGLLERHGNEYRPMGAVEALDVPETLHALIAARLDGLAPEERRLLEPASVLGKTFPKRALTRISGLGEAELEPLLASLLRKEVLTLQSDPRSPERGQYGFLQALVQKVAYDTLAKPQRKALHLEAAAYFESGLGPDEEEIAEVIASHYVEAYRAAPEAEDAAEIRRKARKRLTRAGERAASLAATEEAQHYFEQAAELADDMLDRAELLERAGTLAWTGGRNEQAEERFGQAMTHFEREGETHAAARVSARLGEVLWDLGRIEEGIERMERSFAVLSADAPDADLATLAAQLGRLQHFTGEANVAAERIEFALDLGESLRLPEVISQALNTKSLILSRRPHEAHALVRQALEIALENDLPAAALRAYNNLGVSAQARDRLDEWLEYAQRGLELSRKRGDRSWEWRFLGGIAENRYSSGEWDEALASAAEIPEDVRPGSIFLLNLPLVVRILVHRGGVEELRRLSNLLEQVDSSADVQEQGVVAWARALFQRGEGRLKEAIAMGEEAVKYLRVAGSIGSANDAFLDACESALALGDLGKLQDLVAECEDRPGAEQTRLLEAHLERFKAHLAADRGETETAERYLSVALAGFREIGQPFPLAVMLLEYGEWLAGQERGIGAGPILTEAREVFERLGAKPWLERVSKAASGEEIAAGAPA
jgi:class 3 adenylate cyclase/predicted ATPase